jgi:thioredoxin reductase
MLQEQALNAGAEFSMVDVEALRLKDPYLVMETDEEMVTAKAVIVAGGSSLRKLGLPKEEELHGNGVSYCASCDGPFFSGQDVAVVGGGHVEVDLSMRTPVPGVFAAGDIRQQSVAQLAASAGDGATAAISAFRYVSGRQWPS